MPWSFLGALRLRSLGSKDRMGLTHLICASLKANDPPFEDICGLHVGETVSTEMGSSNYAALARFAKSFAIVSIYYAQDCSTSQACHY